MPRLISRAEFARLCKVSKPAITKACGKSLAPACHADRIDVDHPAAVAYRRVRNAAADNATTPKPKPVRKRRRAPTASRKRPAKRRGAPTAARPKAEPGEPATTTEDLDAYAELLRPLVERFGTARTFLDWLKASKEIELIRARKLENEEAEGRLIARDFVSTHVVKLVDACWRRLLQDAPKTIARRIYALARAEEPVEAAERVVTEIIGSLLEGLKTTAAKLVRNA